MDRDEIMNEIDELTEQLKSMKPTDKDYPVIQAARKELHEMLLKEDRALEERSFKNQQIDIEERRLISENCWNAEKVHASKIDSLLGFGKTILGLLGTACLMLLLDETKRENIIDKDLFSMIRGWFPKS